MFTLKESVYALFDLLFPRDIRVSVFDSLPRIDIERCARQMYFHGACECLAPLPYKKPLVRYAIQAVKYHGHKRAAVLLGETLAPFVAEELSDRRMFGSFMNPLLIPIPLHKTRLRERGFNQSERIASALYASMLCEGMTLEQQLLERTKHTESQAHSTSKAERFANMEGAFTVTDPERVAHQDILLLDDVMTTGATLSVAQKALYNAGARNVLCVAVAH